MTTMIISSLAARAGLQAQRIRIVSLTLGLLLLPSLASAEVLVIDVEGMTCAGCRTKVKESLTELPFIGTVTTSIAGETVCAETQGTRDDAAVNTAIEGLGYRVAALELQPACPAELSRTPDPWDNRTDGLDVQVISQGEKVDLKGHLVDDKFTIIDFGAPWCGPCHTAAETLSAYLRDHKDVAVRVVNLRADDVTLSYALPAAQQHLLYAPGLPWFLVYSPSGRVIHKSTSVEKVLAAIEKKRK